MSKRATKNASNENAIAIETLLTKLRSTNDQKSKKQIRRKLRKTYNYYISRQRVATT